MEKRVRFSLCVKKMSETQMQCRFRAIRQAAMDKPAKVRSGLRGQVRATPADIHLQQQVTIRT